MYLGLDTTGAYCSAALVGEAQILARQTLTIQKGHDRVLAPMVRDILKSVNVAVRDLGKIAVCTGPGSFTGLRVGLSFAKGLALPWQIPVIGISALEVWAIQADPEGVRRILSVADVRRGEVLVQNFKNGQALQTPRLAAVESMKTKAGPITGSGAHLLTSEEHSGFIEPAILAWLTTERTPKSHPPEPLYPRPPDAKLPSKTV